MFTLGLRFKHHIQVPCKNSGFTRQFVAKGATSLSQYQDARKSIRQQPRLEPAPIAQPVPSTGRAGSGKITTTDPLVVNVLSDRDQRKADWTILREMAKYLWPKVSH